MIRVASIKYIIWINYLTFSTTCRPHCIWKCDLIFLFIFLLENSVLFWFYLNLLRVPILNRVEKDYFVSRLGCMVICWRLYRCPMKMIIEAPYQILWEFLFSICFFYSSLHNLQTNVGIFKWSAAVKSKYRNSCEGVYSI